MHNCSLLTVKEFTMAARPKRVELSASLSKSCNLKEKDCTQNINSVFSEIVNLLSEGKDVKVGSFGVFKVSTVKEHMGRNPRTGEAVHVPEKKKVVFCPSKNMLDLANEKPLFDNQAENDNSDLTSGSKKLVKEPNLRIDKPKKPSMNNSFDF